jgi:RND family efflux transporter MFP subunit
MKAAAARALYGSLVLVATGCGTPQETPVPLAREPIPVDIITIRPTTLENHRAVVGNVRARNEVVVAGRVLGHIRSVAVDAGDVVRAGQTLVILDDRALQATVAAAGASVRAAESATLVADQTIVAAQSQLRLAELTHARYTSLLAQESVSQQEFDVVQARLESAQTALGSAESAQRQAEANLAGAVAVATGADLALGYAMITAPVSGVVTERLVDAGALATPGGPLLRLEEAGSYRLEVAVPESLQGAVEVGQVVPLEIDAPWAVSAASAGAAVEGAIVEIVPSVDVRSRTFTVKIALPDLGGIRSGQHGRALLPGDTRTALLVPASAVVERGQLRLAWIDEGGHARRRAVTLGDMRSTSYDVLSGLEAGDRVIVDPARIRDGDPVTATESTP